jgi:hypothetical protein
MFDWRLRGDLSRRDSKPEAPGGDARIVAAGRDANVHIRTVSLALTRRE